MKVKVYIFTYKGEVKAFTIDKEIADCCSNERPHYKMKVKKMTEHQFSTFQSIYGHYMLFKNVMDDGETTFDIVTTYKENDTLDNVLNAQYYALEDILKHLHEYPLKEKYSKLIEKCLSKAYDGDSLNFNVIRVYLRYISDLLK